MFIPRWLSIVVAIVCVGVCANLFAQQKLADAAKNVLNQDYNLKQRYAKGQKRFYRLWMTVEIFDAKGDVSSRSQWRGDIERLVLSVDPSGKADERVTWKNVGMRQWSDQARGYRAPEPYEAATGITYRFSAEDSYDELQFDLKPLMNSPMGAGFYAGLEVSAHFEFDFMRSSRHASIEKLRRPGEMLRHTPEEGKVFSLDFPPALMDSKLRREHVAVGFRGITLSRGTACAIIDYHQGPQDFTWTTESSFAPTDTPSSKMSTHLKSWQDGEFLVRIEDASLLEGEFTEHHVMQLEPEKGTPFSRVSRGIWTISEISEGQYASGLPDWNSDQSPIPILRADISK